LSKLDLIGFFLFALFTIMFFMALELGGTEYPWDSATIIGLFHGAGDILVLFVAWEYYVGDKAMVPYSMLRKRVVWSSCLASAFTFGCMFTYSYYLPIYFQVVKEASPVLSGVYVLPGILSQLVMVVISGVLGEFSSFKTETGLLT
jgi:Fungal trichothecene efflux pump (TRI12)